MKNFLLSFSISVNVNHKFVPKKVYKITIFGEDFALIILGLDKSPTNALPPTIIRLQHILLNVVIPNVVFRCMTMRRRCKPYFVCRTNLIKLTNLSQILHFLQILHIGQKPVGQMSLPYYRKWLKEAYTKLYIIMR